MEAKLLLKAVSGSRTLDFTLPSYPSVYVVRDPYFVCSFQPRILEKRAVDEN